MARLNTLKTIDNTRGKINPNYDMTMKDIRTLYEKNISKVDAMLDSFVLGYVQGVKAQKKGRAYNK